MRWFLLLLLLDDGTRTSKHGVVREADMEHVIGRTVRSDIGKSSLLTSASDTDQANVALSFRSSDESLFARFFAGRSLSGSGTIHRAHLESASPLPSALAPSIRVTLCSRASLPDGSSNAVQFVFSSSLSRRRRCQRSRGRSCRVRFMGW